MVLPPLFLHFALVFPERPHIPGYSALLARWLPAVYLPGAVLGSTRALAVLRSGIDPEYFVRVIALLDRLEYVYLAAFFAAGLAILLRALSARALGHRQAPAAMDRLGHGARRVAVRARLRAAVRARRRSVDPDGPVGDPARLHPAGVCLGDHPLPPDGRRDHPQAPADLHLRGRGDRRDLRADPARLGRLRSSRARTEHRWIIAFLATVVVILLAKPVKDGLQKAIDRAFYRDRYDYRRALVGFARELNSDLDLNRLADRLVTRVRETIELDRMAFLLATDAGDFESISARRLRERCRRS